MIFLSLLGSSELVIILLPVLLISILPIIALVDILKSSFVGSNDKIIWVLLVVFTWLLGAILYYLIGRNQKVGH